MFHQISIIIPTKNRTKSLENCINSLLIQTYKPKEILVIDNSINKTAKKVVDLFINKTDIKIRHISEKRLGPSYARNKGIKEASYNLLAFVDDDCIVQKEWVSQITEGYKKTQNIVLQGQVLNGGKNSILSSIENFMTKLFFLQGYCKIDNDIFNSLLDTKNFAVQKSLLNKYRLSFNPVFAPFSIFEDIDFAKKLRSKGISILYNARMKVWHHKKAHLINYFQREFKKGRANYRYQSLWKTFDDKLENKISAIKLRQNPLIKKYLILQKKKYTKLRKKLTNKTLGEKSLIFIFFFYILLFIFILINKLGYYYEKIITFIFNKKLYAKNY